MVGVWPKTPFWLYPAGPSLKFF